jgi:2-phospho-L-lactate guanylyltransferase
MTIWAIVPVKPLRHGKSRLAGALNNEDRAKLNRMLLEHTLKTLKGLKQIEQVLVVSRDSSVLALARELGARTVQEDGAPTLNTALKRATVVAQVYASRGVLILPADLPLLKSNDVLALLQHAVNPPVVVIAPDRRHEGTNALLLAPSNLIEYDFGINSFQRHCDRARRAGARLEVMDLPSLGLDLDLPEDLELVRKKQGLNLISKQ